MIHRGIALHPLSLFPMLLPVVDPSLISPSRIAQRRALHWLNLKKVSPPLLARNLFHAELFTSLASLPRQRVCWFESSHCIRENLLWNKKLILTNHSERQQNALFLQCLMYESLQVCNNLKVCWARHVSKLPTVALDSLNRATSRILFS